MANSDSDKDEDEDEARCTAAAAGRGPKGGGVGGHLLLGEVIHQRRDLMLGLAPAARL